MQRGPSMVEAPLEGVGVLVTRPRTQAIELVSAIESAGGSAFCFPVMEIAALDENVVSARAAESTGTTPAAVEINQRTNSIVILFSFALHPRSRGATQTTLTAITSHSSCPTNHVQLSQITGTLMGKNTK